MTPVLQNLALFATLVVALASSAQSAEPSETLGDVAVWRELRYHEGPSRNLTLDLATPPDAAGAPCPLVVVIHGGGWLEGDKSSFSTATVRTPGNIFDFAEQGLAAATMNYRLSGEAPYPVALEDCQRAIAWLRSNAERFHIDPTRVGVYGNSAGGHLALLMAMAQTEGALPTQVQAAASDSGPLDLEFGHSHNQLLVVIEKFLGGPPAAGRIEAYRRASPANHVAANLPPLLLLYGAKDEQVDIRTADDFVAKLGRAGHTDLSYFRLADVGHCPHSLVGVPYLRQVVIDFFARALHHDTAGLKK
ncbi:MAG: alpha/beta hydrolase [Pirellulales bacterium]